jgi:hypothetical protein
MPIAKIKKMASAPRTTQMLACDKFFSCTHEDNLIAAIVV